MTSQISLESQNNAASNSELKLIAVTTTKEAINNFFFIKTKALAIKWQRHCVCVCVCVTSEHK